MKTIRVAVQEYPFSFHIIMVGILLSLAFYMYFINSAVRSTAMRNDIESEVSALQANLSELETNYVRSVSSITFESASSLGLREPISKIFISKISSPNKVLSLNKQ